MNYKKLSLLALVLLLIPALGFSINFYDSDSFEDNQYTSDWSWSVIDGSWSTDTTYVKDGSYSLERTAAQNNDDITTDTSDDFNTSVVKVSAWGYATSQDTSTVFSVSMVDEEGTSLGFTEEGGSTWWCGGSSISTDLLSNNVWMKVVLSYDYEVGELSCYAYDNDGTTLLDSSTGNGKSFGTFDNITLSVRNWGYNFWFDNVTYSHTPSLIDKNITKISDFTSDDLFKYNSTQLLNYTSYRWYPPVAKYELGNEFDDRGEAADTSYYNATNTGVWNGYTFYDGELNGGVSLTSDGYYGSAYSFDGTDDYVDLGTPASLNTPYMSVSAWFKTPGSGADQHIINRDNDNTPGTFLIYLLSGGILRFRVRDDSTTGYDISTSATYDDGDWHHVTGTFENGTQALYIDGNLIDSVERGFTSLDQDNLIGVQIGQRPENTDMQFNGNLDEVRVWNRSLTQSEIEEEMYSSYPVQGSDLIASYSFEENNSTYTMDTKNYVNGTLGGAGNFDGSDDYIDLGNTQGTSLDLQNKDFTITGWMKTNTLIPSHDSNILAEDNNDYLLEIRESSPNFLRFYNGSSMTNSFTVEENTWIHFTVVYDGTNLMIYKDGVLETSVSHSGITLSTAGNTYIGNRGAGGNQPFNGSLDDVRIYNIALNSTEVNELYNNSFENFRTKPEKQTLTLNSTNLGVTKNFTSWEGTNITLNNSNVWNNTIQILDPYTTLNETYNYYTVNSNITLSFSNATSGVNEDVTFTRNDYVTQPEYTYTNYLIWNNTYQNFTGSNPYTSTINTPVIENKNATVNVNATINVALNEINESLNLTTNNTQWIYKQLIDNCTSYSTNTFNITGYEETTKNAENIDMEIVITNLRNNNVIYNDTLTNQDTYEICKNTANQNYQINMEILYKGSNNTEYTLNREYYILNATADNTVNEIPLYALTDADSTGLTINIEDSSGSPEENIYARLKRYYWGENAYAGTCMARSNTEGAAYTSIEPTSAYYKIELVNEDGNIIKTFDRQKFTTNSITLSTAETTTPTYLIIDDNVVASTNWVNSTRVKTSVTDTSGLGLTLVMQIHKTGVLMDTLVCERELTGSSSYTTYCDITNQTGASYRINIKALYNGDWYNIPVPGGSSITYGTSTAEGNVGLFTTFLLCTFLGGLGAMVSPAVALLLVDVGFGVSGLIGWISFGVSGVIGLLMLTVGIIWVTKR